MNFRLVAATALAATASASLAQDLNNPQFFTNDMSEFGWQRQETNSTFWAWSSYSSVAGPNLPNGGGFPVPIPSDFLLPTVYDVSPFALVTSGGNLYSFANPVEINVDIPNYDLGEGFETVIVLQALFNGAQFVAVDENLMPLETAPVTIDGVEADEVRVLRNDGLEPGSQFGGAQQEVLLRWTLPGNASGYSIEVRPPFSSTSFADATIDTFVREAVDDGCTRTDISGDGVVNISDLFAYINAFTSSDQSAEFDGNGVLNISDLFAYINAFTGCP
ncbi:MAG: GC-type dockerin domain-anchored protein [Planctomycetota bacterium]